MSGSFKLAPGECLACWGMLAGQCADCGRTVGHSAVPTRQCPAYHAPTGLRCLGRVTEQTTHAADHFAFTGEDGLEELRWTEELAAYEPPGVANPGRTRIGTRSRQVGGGHYVDHRIQPWDVIDEYGLDFYRGSVLKYVLRAGAKPGNSRLQDLKKARHYLDKAIELEGAAGGGE